MLSLKENAPTLKTYFYEELFTSSCIQNLTHDMNLPYVEPDFNKYVNYDPGKTPIPLQLVKRLAPKFSETYKYIESEFGYLPKAWSLNREFS